MGKRVFRDMADRRGEISRMIEILDNHKDWKSLTFFQYKGGNGDLIKPLTKIRVSKKKAHKRVEYTVIIGPPNYAERQYIKKFCGGELWPDDFYETFPKSKAS